jgi:hypothetical protein
MSEVFQSNADALCAQCEPAPLAFPKLVEIDDCYIDPDTVVAEWEGKPRCLPAALSYAADRGWYVFPAPRGKKKSHKRAEYSGGRNWGMTRDPDEIRRDFARWPNANTGLPTGAENGFFVLEADTLKGHGVDGIASLRALEAEHGKLPDTYTTESPSGSPHLYFKHPGNGIKIKNSASEIAPGVDVRGDGGLVIAPPSVKPGIGAYTVIRNVELAEPPAWLLERVIEKERPTPEPRSSEGNNTTASSEVAAALAVIDPDIENGPWFNIGCALFNELGDEAGFEAWNQWPYNDKKSKKYPGQRDITKQWQSMAAKDGYDYNAETIFFFANEADPDWGIRYKEALCQEYEEGFREASRPENIAKLLAEVSAQREEPRTAASETRAELPVVNSSSIVAGQEPQESEAPGAEQAKDGETQGGDRPHAEPTTAPVDENSAEIAKLIAESAGAKEPTAESGYEKPPKRTLNEMHGTFRKWFGDEYDLDCCAGASTSWR